MISLSKAALRGGLGRLAVQATGRAAEVSLRVPPLRKRLAGMLFRRLDTAYEVTQDDSAALRHQRWFGMHLRPFVQRLIAERPTSARAVVRFMTTWMQDMHRRSAINEGGRVSPCTVVIEPTDRCNFSCPGCYAHSTRRGSDLPYEQFLQIVEQVTSMGVSLVTISGGEPFLRERTDRCLTRIARRFHRHGFLVYTNGSLIDADTVERLARVGNIFPAISVEGFEHQTDARRGRGCYEQNRRLRRLCARRGVMTGFSATLTRENCEAVCTDAFLERRLEEGDLFGWFFLLQPIGRGPRADLMPTADQRAKLRETITRWRNEDRPLLLGDFWNDGHLVGGCLAGGRHYFHIYANGEISPCVFSPLACGNVLDIIDGRSDYDSLDDFVQNHPLFQAFRQEQAAIVDRNRPCLLIDHPEVVRRLAGVEGCRAARNCPPDYLDGEIARAIDDVAREWEQTSGRLPEILPAPDAAAAADAVAATRSA